MKRVTNKTVMNIYQRWMTISAVEFDFVIDNKNMTLTEIANSDKGLVKLNYVLEDYSDKQVRRIIVSLEEGWAWEADYLKDIMLHLLKSQLRQRKLNRLNID